MKTFQGKAIYFRKVHNWYIIPGFPVFQKTIIKKTIFLENQKFLFYTSFENILKLVHKFVATIFLNVAKAFDCVDRNTLIKKMQQIGIRDNTLKLFQAILIIENKWFKLMILLVIWEKQIMV